MRVERIKVEPKSVKILGNKPKGVDDPLWAGLDLARAEPRTQSTLMLAICGQDEAPEDIHLAVPWCHPEDQTGSADDFDCIYRVRPRMEAGKMWKRRTVESVAFERWDGEWFIAVEFSVADKPVAIGVPCRPQKGR